MSTGFDKLKNNPTSEIVGYVTKCAKDFVDMIMVNFVLWDDVRRTISSKKLASKLENYELVELQTLFQVEELFGDIFHANESTDPEWFTAKRLEIKDKISKLVDLKMEVDSQNRIDTEALYKMFSRDVDLILIKGFETQNKDFKIPIKEFWQNIIREFVPVPETKKSVVLSESELRKLHRVNSDRVMSAKKRGEFLLHLPTDYSPENVMKSEVWFVDEFYQNPKKHIIDKVQLLQESLSAPKYSKPWIWRHLVLEYVQRYMSNPKNWSSSLSTTILACLDRFDHDMTILSKVIKTRQSTIQDVQKKAELYRFFIKYDYIYVSLFHMDCLTELESKIGIGKCYKSSIF